VLNVDRVLKQLHQRRQFYGETKMTTDILR